MTTWLHEQRLAEVHSWIRASDARSVLDLGCGDGDLLTRLVAEARVEKIVGIDLSWDAFDRLRVRLGRVVGHQPMTNVDLVHGSITDRWTAFHGFDCALLIETIEHVDPDRLSAVESAVFHNMRPRTAVVTTPNADFNHLLGVPALRFRHPDHRFEWGRTRFRGWAQAVAARNGYCAACSDIAGRHPEYGGATQMAVFERLVASGQRRLA